MGLRERHDVGEILGLVVEPTESPPKGIMASNIESDGKTVTVTTGDGHRIGFGVAELNVASIHGGIRTLWNGDAPVSAERAVRAAKVEAEAYSDRHHASAPAVARAWRDRDRGALGTLLVMFAF